LLQNILTLPHIQRIYQLPLYLLTSIKWRFCVSLYSIYVSSSQKLTTLAKKRSWCDPLSLLSANWHGPSHWQYTFLWN